MAEEMIKKYNIKLNSDKTQIMVDGKIGKSSTDTAWVKKHKAEIIDILLEKEAKEEAAREEYRQKLAAIEGLIELQNAMQEWSEYKSAMNRFIERDCIGEAPEKPKATVSELKEKYPKAAAYVYADNWSYAAHYYKAILGERAKAKILDGEDYTEVILDMKEAWDDYTKERWD